jgi:hypothetical protein
VTGGAGQRRPCSSDEHNSMHGHKCTWFEENSKKFEEA